MLKRAIKLDKNVPKRNGVENNNKTPFPVFKRNNYFYGKLLTAADFQEEQNYFINKQRLINRMLFGQGVVSGLEVTSDRSAGVIRLSEGFALDGYGREIVLQTKLQCNLNQKYTPKEVGKTRDLFVWIRYDETKTDPIPAVGDVGADFSMITEGSKIEVDWTPPEPSSIDNMVLAKVTVKTDGKKIYIDKIDNSATEGGTPLRKEVISARALLWSEEEPIHTSSPSKRGYETRTDSNGNTKVVFGDGQSGAVPPTVGISPKQSDNKKTQDDSPVDSKHIRSTSRKKYRKENNRL